VYWWFRRFVRFLLFRTIHDVAMMLDREQAGREASPSGGILDSQSIKAPHGVIRGYDAGKKVMGRKRHTAVDTGGRLLMVNLTCADVSDSAGAQTILAAIRKRWPWLKHLFADGTYDQGRLMSKAAFLDFVVEIVRRMDHEPGFKVLPVVRPAHSAMPDADGGTGPPCASCARLPTTLRMARYRRPPTRPVPAEAMPPWVRPRPFVVHPLCRAPTVSCRLAA
jgi:hypothetical protein